MKSFASEESSLREWLTLVWSEILAACRCTPDSDESQIELKGAPVHRRGLLVQRVPVTQLDRRKRR